jgi:hypothetical protein
LIPIGSTWLHQRGQACIVLGHCLLSGEGALGVLYQGEQGYVWCRPVEQFLDGRLQCISRPRRYSAEDSA